MVADVEPAGGVAPCDPRQPTDWSESVPGDGPAVDPPEARPAIYRDDPLAPLATGWPHIEAALVRKQALSRRRR
jgi:hypothetical protein